MTYQHQGKRFLADPPELEKKITKRYFRLEFQCANPKCNKSNRLKQLKLDPLEKFSCPYCNNNTFEVVKKRVGETSIREKDTVIIVEKKTTIGRRLG